MKRRTALKSFLSKVAGFFKAYGHKIFTFCVGLAFIGAVFFCVGFAASRIYRVFVPNDIYSDASYKTSLYGGSVYETVTDETVEEGSAEFFEDYIQNLIRQDMPDFDDPMDLNDEYIISFGLWQAIKLNNAQGVYSYDSRGNFRVPSDDVEMFALYCFDFARKIDHRSVDICGDFSYNFVNKTYKIRSAGVESYLIPDVVDVEQDENDTYILTVDCYEEEMMSIEDPTNDPDNFYKRVKLTLQDMGIQSYSDETGNPVHRYMILSMDTVNTEDEPEQEIDDVELT